MLKRLRLRLAALLTAGVTVTSAGAANVDVRETVRVHRASGHFAHTRPHLLHDAGTGEFIRTADGVVVGTDRVIPVDANGYLTLNDETARRLVPAYLDDLGIPRAGQRWIAQDVLDPRDHLVIWEESGLNVKTTVQIDFTFAQTYSTSTGANGLNYIALSNDSLTETSSSTTLSSEIAANGLSRAQGTYAHTTGASTSTITKTFTCSTASQSAQKSALFTASSSGTMGHALSFTQRTLQIGDNLIPTFTITIT